MVGNPAIHVSSLPTSVSSCMITLPGNSLKFVPLAPLSIRNRKKFNKIRATSADGGNVKQSYNSEAKNPLAVVFDIPRRIWKQTLGPLSDFGFGRKSVWEGGVGLFLVSGTILFVLSMAWLRAFQINSKFRKYTAVFEFAQASGISTGTPVRIRGVTVGNVTRVNPSLKSIEAVVEIEDDKTIIPRNSFVEVNQSGLLMETKIDISPRDPIPTPLVGPLHEECAKEGLVVCDREKIKGHQGVSLDELVGIYTRLGRDVEGIGVVNSYALAERVFAVMEEARPLLTQMKAMALDVQPLLAEIRDSGLLKEVESLTQSLTEASNDLRRVHSSIMTPENTELIQKSIHTLIFTLKNVENITSDMLGFTGDESTKKSLKILIKNLSRLL